MSQPSPAWRQMDEPELAQHFTGDDQGGAQQALAELLRRHEDRLRAQARRRAAGEQNTADDFFQDLCLRLWKGRRTYRPDSEWLHWASRILTLLTIDAFRRRAGLPTVDFNSESGQAVNLVESPGLPPDSSLKGDELQAAMEDCLRRLAPEERQALIGQHFDGHTYQELSESTGVNANTLGVRAYKARQKLKECLTRKGYTGTDL